MESEAIVQKYSAALLLFFCVGCQSAVNQVEFVVPKGFHGTIIIRKESGAPAIPKVNNRYVLSIPEDGVFVFSGDDPFGSYLCTARFANGDPIWVPTHIDDRPKKGRIELFGGYSHAEWSTEGGRGVSDYRMFIGTEEEWKNRSSRDRKEE